MRFREAKCLEMIPNTDDGDHPDCSWNERMSRGALERGSPTRRGGGSVHKETVSTWTAKTLRLRYFRRYSVCLWCRQVRGMINDPSPTDALCDQYTLNLGIYRVQRYCNFAL